MHGLSVLSSEKGMFVLREVYGLSSEKGMFVLKEMDGLSSEKWMVCLQRNGWFVLREGLFYPQGKV